MKKILALLCVLALVVSMVACGAGNVDSNDGNVQDNSASQNNVSNDQTEDQADKEPVELVYWYMNGVGVQEYTDEVEAELNKILASTPGYEHITIKLHPCKDYATDVALGQTTGEQMDLMATYGIDWYQQAQDGAFIPLNDIIAGNPEITADLPDWMMEYGVVDGQNYFIPNYQQAANQYYYATSREWLEAYLEDSDQTLDQIKNLFYTKNYDGLAKFYEDYVLFVREYTGSETKWIWRDTFSNHRVWALGDTVSVLDLGSYAKFYLDENNKVVFSQAEDGNIAKAYIKNGEWFANGLIYENILTDAELCTAANLMEDKSFVYFYVQSFGDEEMASAALTEKNGYDTIAFPLWDTVHLGPSNAAGGVAVSASCEHPEEAGKVLALLFNSKYEQFYNTLVYGLEGTHYTKLNDNQVETLEFSGTQGGADTTYCYWKWIGGNTFNAWLNQSMTPEQETYIIEQINESPNTVPSPVAGIVIDITPVENEIAQLKAVYEEYHETLRCGVKGTGAEAYLQEYLDKMETAGLSKVIDELQSQVDAFLANK